MTNRHSLVKDAYTGAIALAIASTTTLSAAEIRPPSTPLHHVTPWTPMPAPRLGAAPKLAPLLTLSTKFWTDLGPAPLASENHVSGRITGIAADLTQAGIIYVTAAGGGVWKSIDGGTSWTPLTDTQRTLSMGAIATGTAVIVNGLRKERKEIIYAGTGEANNSGDSNFGRGILISTDSGATWRLSTGPSNAFDRLTTSQIAVDPTNGLVAYAAMADLGFNGLFGSNTGIWKTTNGGTTWTNTTAAIDSMFSWSAVVIDPNHPHTIYAAAGYPFGAATNGVYKSINGGSSWHLLSAGPKGMAAGRIAIAVSRTNSQIVYVTASGTWVPGSTSVPGTTNYGTLYKIMRSDNGGSSFTDLTNGTPNYMGAHNSRSIQTLTAKAGMTPM
jgi:photosystem II stability/assembly factor-like uncharacterized protein